MILEKLIAVNYQPLAVFLLLSVSFLMPIPGVFNYYLEIGILGMPTENLF